MLQLLRNKDFFGIGLFLLLIVLTSFQQFIAPAIGVFLLIVLTEGFIFKSLTFKFNGHSFLFVVLFLLYLLGLIWSDHPDVGWKLLEYKMSFFIFPLVFMFRKKDQNPWIILQGVVWGCIGLTIQLYAGQFFGEIPGRLLYDVSREVVLIHPTYTSIYLTIAVAFLVIGAWKEKINWPLFVIIPVVFAFLFTIYQIGSFAAILFLLFLTACFVGWLIKRYFGKIVAIIYALICPVVIWFSVQKLDVLAYDIEMLAAVYTEIKAGKTNYLEQNRTVVSGTKERVILWMISAEIIAENPFGVGTGDIDFALAEKCKKYDLDLLLQHSLNPHNQFLQIGIDIGFPGILFLIFLIVSIFWKAWRARNYLLMIVLLSLIFNAQFESVLQRQSGIVFFVLMITVLVIFNREMGDKPEISLKSEPVI